MMREEFEKLTGFYPSSALYRAIEAEYMESDMNKTAFCKAYLKNADGLAQKIQDAANMDAWKREREMDELLDQQKKVSDGWKQRVDQLKKQLDEELEWRFHGTHSKLKACEYAEMMKYGAKPVTDDEATDYIFEEFGFMPDRIKIVHSISVYDINRHKQLRKRDDEERKPIYGASDFNYIRFNIEGRGGTWMYEIINGELHQFFD